MNQCDRDLPVDFDDYADSYEDVLRRQLGFFGEERSYFSAYKVEITARLCPLPPSSILDFGCGVGLSLAHLSTAFPGSKIFATDISKRSVDRVRSDHPRVIVLADDDLGGQSFSLIFVSGVFHHVPAASRAALVSRLAALLEPGGLLCVFEHNPYNPVTRYLVASCPFDEDAALISKRGMHRLLTAHGELKIYRSGYCLFFPQPLARVRPLEHSMTWLPIGGQYFVAAAKSHDYA